MRYLFLLAALALTACARPVPQALSCPAENATYRLRGQPGAELRLVKPPHPITPYSDLAAKVDFEGETFWFSFVSSNGYSRDYVLPTTDPFKEEDEAPDGEAEKPDAEESEIVSFDAAYKVLENAPQAGQPAPAHILATGIGRELWYSIPRRELPRALWDLAACR